MVISRDVFTFNECLKKIRAEASESYRESPIENIQKSDVLEAEVAKFVNREIEYKDLSQEAAMYCTLRSIAAKRKDPLFYSRLPNVLELETWSPNDALLILAGVDPFAAIFDWTYENFMGAQIPEPKIRHANCFSEVRELYDYPVAEDSEYTSKQLKEMIEEAKKNGSSQADLDQLNSDLWHADHWSKDETSKYKSRVLSLRSQMLGILKRRWDSGVEDETKKHSPAFFVEWAEKRGFEVEWATWARANNLLAENQSVFAAPYFDPDSDEYPELLHIAIRAWEHAKSAPGGTPKQRVLEYLQSRYPKIGESSKEAIAVVTNWQKAGGRPRKG